MSTLEECIFSCQDVMYLFSVICFSMVSLFVFIFFLHYPKFYSILNVYLCKASFIQVQLFQIVSFGKRIES